MCSPVFLSVRKAKQEGREGWEAWRALLFSHPRWSISGLGGVEGVGEWGVGVEDDGLGLTPAGPWRPPSPVALVSEQAVLRAHCVQKLCLSPGAILPEALASVRHSSRHFTPKTLCMAKKKISHLATLTVCQMNRRLGDKKANPERDGRIDRESESLSLDNGPNATHYSFI